MSFESTIWLPNGLDFSPYYEGILQGALAICAEYGGDRKLVQLRIAEVFYSKTKNPMSLAGNCLSGMKSYGLIEDNLPTELGYRLLRIDDQEKMYKEFALHLVMNCYGLDLLDAIDEIELSDGWVAEKKVQVAEVLKENYGIQTAGSGGNGKAVATMKTWLEKAHLVEGHKWGLNRRAINELLGSWKDAIDSLRSLKHEEQCFLKTLLNLYEEGNSFDANYSEYIDSNRVRKNAQTQYGIKLSSTNLPSATLKPLKERGLIEFVYSGKGSVHGGARYFIKPAQLLLDEDLDNFIKRLGSEKEISIRVREGLRIPYGLVIEMCASDDTYTKGVGLELLGLKMLKSAGLKPIDMRVREEAVSGAEVDLLFADERGTYTVWQVQCKNTASVSSDRVYREIGMALVAHRSMVCIITTGVYTESALGAALRANKQTSMTVILIGNEDIERLVACSISASELIREKMLEVKRLKTARARSVVALSDS